MTISEPVNKCIEHYQKLLQGNLLPQNRASIERSYEAIVSAAKDCGYIVQTQELWWKRYESRQLQENAWQAISEARNAP